MLTPATRNRKQNIDGKEQWGRNTNPNPSEVIRSCLGYARTPGWYRIQKTVFERFGGFEGLRTLELGCGLGKASLLFALRGAKVTLMDYNRDQLASAQSVAEWLAVDCERVEADLLQMPAHLAEQFDVTMSFGTVEHFWDEERQFAFDHHAGPLKPGGLVIIWVPNRYGFLFHLGRGLRTWLGRLDHSIDETPFTRKELKARAEAAGLKEAAVTAGDCLMNDFHRFILDVPRLLRRSRSTPVFTDAQAAREELLHAMTANRARKRLWNELFAYPLMLTAVRSESE